MSLRTFSALTALVALAATACLAQQPKRRTSALGYDDTPVIPGQKWKVHDIARPHPKMVTPGAQLGMPPSDAVVLFDGKDLSKWGVRDRKTRQIGPATWKVQDGATWAEKGSGDLVSLEKFGDAQIHIEWAAPADVGLDDGQWRGNSGVLVMGRYEIQVLDSINNPTYADGQAASIYGQWPPLMNASRGPGQWNVYDIIFEAPVFEDGKLVKPPFATVFHNGVLMHHRKEIIGPMAHREVRKFEPHGPEEPLALQDHDTRTRFRNIWVRKLKGYDQP